MCLYIWLVPYGNRRHLKLKFHSVKAKVTAVTFVCQVSRATKTEALKGLKTRGKQSGALNINSSRQEEQEMLPLRREENM